jgi:hypothetical protein
VRLLGDPSRETTVACPEGRQRFGHASRALE